MTHLSNSVHAFRNKLGLGLSAVNGFAPVVNPGYEQQADGGALEAEAMGNPDIPYASQLIPHRV